VASRQWGEGVTGTVSTTTKVARQVAGGYIVLPRSAYAHLRRYGKNARYVVDAVEYANWSIGRDLRRQRLAAGLTQAEVARRAGIRVETLSRLENARGNPTVATVSKIVRAISRAGRPKARRRAWAR
jgi:DNA-binding XRE family transcriptional regulator